MSELKTKAIKYLQLQDRLNALKCEIIGMIGIEHTSLHFDLYIQTKCVDIIDEQKLKREYPEAYRKCTVGAGTILKVTRGGCYG